MAAARPASTPKAKSEFDSAVELQNAGKLDEAEAIYNRFLRNNPKHADAQHNLGLIKLNRGEPAIALAYLYYSLDLKPNSAHAQNTLGNALLRLGRKQDAEAAYRKSVEIDPRNLQAWYNLGLLLHNDGRRADAENCYAKVIALKPDHVAAYVNRATIMRSARRFDEALDFLEKALKVLPRSELIHNTVGNAYRDLDRLEEAVAAYRQATTTNPGYALAWHNLGTALSQLGRKDEAITALRRAIALAPRFGDAHVHLADLTRPSLDDPSIADMKHYLADPATTANDRMHLAFALGRTHDVNGSFDKAFSYFRQANRLKRDSLNFDIDSERRLMASIREVFSKAFMAAAEPSGVMDRTPIFIIGMMRSGTTLMEQVLASHPEVASGDELPWIPDLTLRGDAVDGLEYPQSMRAMGAAELTRRGEKYIALMRQRFGEAPRHVTDKLPGNFLNAGFIHLALPQAKIIHMRRDPFDTCLSIYTTLFAELHHYAYDLTELGEFYVMHHELMRHWDDVMPGRIYHQNYEKLTADPEAEIRKVLAFCGLPFNERCLAFHASEGRVRTASASQVREKLHGRSVGRWRNYEQYLGEWKTRFAGLAPE